MAKHNKTKQNTAHFIRYEIYGIIIVLLSMIALAQIGIVGEYFMIVFRFFVGEWGFLLPIFCLYIAIFIMVKRSKPQFITLKKSGLYLIFSGLLVMSHMFWFTDLDPNHLYSSSSIVSTTWAQLTSGIKNSNLLTIESGGGLVGSFCYSALFYFFDQLGVRLIIIAWFVIGFILLTGKSLVDILIMIKTYLSDKFSAIFSTDKPKQNTKNLPREEAQVESSSPEEHKKAPKFFDFLDRAKNVNTIPPSEHTDKNQSHSSSLEDQPLDTRPIIRNFQEVVEQEQNHGTPLPHHDLEFQAKPHENIPYKLPSLLLLAKPIQSMNNDSADYKTNARKLETLLESFGVRAKVIEIVRGPSVTRYEIQPDVGVKVSKIVSLTDDIALSLAAKDIRMEAPIPGKAAIGIEVPNSEVSIVTMREVMETPLFQDAESKLSITLGRDISGQPIIGNLAKMPHLLVAGATGSGKSVCINGIITSILYKAKPNEVKFLMVDPKMVELNVYNGIPHLLAPVVTDPRRASLALKKIVVEMEKRYELFSKSGARNIEGYNQLVGEYEKLPYIVVIIDELADLMIVAANDVEDSICRLAQMARASGIHLIIATQRPSVDVITGVIKANIPSRIAFGVSSQVDSRTILDMVGAEKLLGRGDMLYLPMGASKATRIQGAFLSDAEVEKVVQFVRSQEQAVYIDDLVPDIDEQSENQDEHEDELFEQAVRILIEAKQASVSLLQRRMRIGYTRAARLIDSMEAKGIIGPYEGSKPREILITMEQFMRIKMNT